MADSTEPDAPEEGSPAPPPSSGDGATAGRERVLRRSTDDRVVFGIAGGLGRYLGIDPVVVRIGFVLLTVFGGSGILLYLIALVVIPEEKPGDAVNAGAAPTVTGQSVAAVIGAALILVGSVSLLGQIVPRFGELLGPALLVAVGVLVIVLGMRR